MSSNNDQIDEPVTRRDMLAGAAMLGVTLTPGFLSFGDDNEIGVFDTHNIQNNGEFVAQDPSPLNFGQGIQAVETGEGGVDVTSPGSSLEQWSEDDAGTLSGPSIDPGELSGEYPMNVRGIAEGGVVASIDPANTSTPVQDAIDAVTAATDNGSVLLPPGRITEGSSLNGLAKTTIVGHGTDRSIVEFTDTTVPCFDLATSSDFQKMTLIGFTIHGSDRASRSATEAAMLVDGIAAQVNLERIKLADQHTGLYFRNGHFYSSRVDTLYCTDLISSTLRVESGGAPLIMENVATGNDDVEPVFDIQANINLSVHGLNIGGNAGPAIVESGTTQSSRISIRRANHEGNGDIVANSTANAICELAGEGHTVIYDLRPSTLSNHDSVFEIAGGGYKRLPFTNGGGSPNVNIVEITTGPAAYCRFGGETGDVTDNSSGAGDELFFCKEDRKLADPRVSKTVTVTTAGTGRVNAVSGTELVRPTLQTLRPATKPAGDYAVDHYFEWDDANGHWDLVLEWITDPGSDQDWTIEILSLNAGESAR